MPSKNPLRSPNATNTPPTMAHRLTKNLARLLELLCITIDMGINANLISKCMFLSLDSSLLAVIEYDQLS